MKSLFLKICILCQIIVILFSIGCVSGAGTLDSVRLSQFKEKVNESQEYYDAWVASDPDNAEAWCIRGMYYNDNYGRYDEAMKSCNKALELNPEYGLAWYLKGIIFLNLNEKNESKSCFQNATKYDPALIQYVPAV